MQALELAGGLVGTDELKLCCRLGTTLTIIYCIHFYLSTTLTLTDFTLLLFHILRSSFLKLLHLIFITDFAYLAGDFAADGLILHYPLVRVLVVII